jgi:hypothetical protein
MRYLAALLFCFAFPASAQVSGEGHFYDTACNSNGYVLTSQNPVGRFFGQGAATSITNERETIYLGTACDASRTGWSGGTWCWANGGVLIEFEEYRIGFPRQGLYCPAGGYQLEFSGCGC